MRLVVGDSEKLRELVSATANLTKERSHFGCPLIESFALRHRVARQLSEGKEWPDGPTNTLG
jgi:hypothetical protein